MIDAAKFLEDLTGRHARHYTEHISDMVVAMAVGDKPALSAARKRLEEVITETMGAAEVLGASLMLQRAAQLLPSEGLAMQGDAGNLLAFAETSTQSILPRVTFTEAVQDMIKRTPVTIRDAAERTAIRISKLYGEDRVVAFVRSAEDAVTERVQGLITQALKDGLAEDPAGRRIRMGVDEVRKATAAWSEGYARMAFRTNVNTAVTAGRFRQAQDPDIKVVIPCLRFDSVGDGDTRDNHDAADGLIFKSDNPVWNQIAPPLGYNCRCQVSLVGLPELRRMGRINSDGSIREDRLPASAEPDVGFRHGGRPDLFMVAR